LFFFEFWSLNDALCFNIWNSNENTGTVREKRNGGNGGGSGKRRSPAYLSMSTPDDFGGGGGVGSWRDPPNSRDGGMNSPRTELKQVCFNTFTIHRKKDVVKLGKSREK
jgi:hypothetical protein